MRSGKAGQEDRSRHAYKLSGCARGEAAHLVEFRGRGHSKGVARRFRGFLRCLQGVVGDVNGDLTHPLFGDTVVGAFLTENREMDLVDRTSQQRRHCCSRSMKKQVVPHC